MKVSLRARRACYIYIAFYMVGLTVVCRHNESRLAHIRIFQPENKQESQDRRARPRAKIRAGRRGSPIRRRSFVFFLPPHLPLVSLSLLTSPPHSDNSLAFPPRFSFHHTNSAPSSSYLLLLIHRLSFFLSCFLLFLLNSPHLSLGCSLSLLPVQRLLHLLLFTPSSTLASSSLSSFFQPPHPLPKKPHFLRIYSQMLIYILMLI